MDITIVPSTLRYMSLWCLFLPAHRACLLCERKLWPPPASRITSYACFERHSLETPSSTTYFTAAGSGVAEVKLIVSGFGLRGYLSAKTFVVKALALILSAASGMSLGKEGPYIHATCISDTVPRLFSSNQSYKQHETLRAGAASGLSVAFGAPVSGVMFALEDLGYVAILC
jgi:chloride channel 3/4/5